MREVFHIISTTGPEIIVRLQSFQLELGEVAILVLLLSVLFPTLVLIR